MRDERTNSPPSHSDYGPHAGPVPSQHAPPVIRDGGFFQAWEDKKNDGPGKEKALSPRRKPGPGGHSPALTWLSLVGLHPCRAQLRFARQRPSYFKFRVFAPKRQREGQVAQNATARNVPRHQNQQNPITGSGHHSDRSQRTMMQIMPTEKLTSTEPALH